MRLDQELSVQPSFHVRGERIFLGCTVPKGNLVSGIGSPHHNAAPHVLLFILAVGYLFCPLVLWFELLSLFSVTWVVYVGYFYVAG